MVKLLEVSNSSVPTGQLPYSLGKPRGLGYFAIHLFFSESQGVVAYPMGVPHFACGSFAMTRFGWGGAPTLDQN